MDTDAAREALREYRAEADFGDAADWLTAQHLIADLLRLIGEEHSAGVLAARKVARLATEQAGISMVAVLAERVR